MAKLSQADIDNMLPQLPEWSVTGGRLHREYKFKDFKTAFEFMKIAAPEIDKMDHHPEWFNVYNRVTVDLTTHDDGGISQKDFDLATLLEGIRKKLS